MPSCQQGQLNAFFPESDAAMKRKKLFTKWNCYLEWTYYFLLHNFHKQFDSKLSQRQIFSG